MLRRFVIHRGALLLLVAWGSILLCSASIRLPVVLITDEVHQGPIIRGADGLPVKLDEELSGQFPVTTRIWCGDDLRNRWADVRGTSAGGGDDGGDQTL